MRSENVCPKEQESALMVAVKQTRSLVVSGAAQVDAATGSDLLKSLSKEVASILGKPESVRGDRPAAWFY